MLLAAFKGESKKILRRRFGFVQRARRERKEGGGKEKKEEGERDRERIDGERSSKSNHVEGREEEREEEEEEEAKKRGYCNRVVSPLFFFSSASALVVGPWVGRWLWAVGDHARKKEGGQRRKVKKSLGNPSPSFSLFSPPQSPLALFPCAVAPPPHSFFPPPVRDGRRRC